MTAARMAFGRGPGGRPPGGHGLERTGKEPRS